MLLDAILARTPHVGPAALLFAAAERGGIVGIVAPTSVTTCYYFVNKVQGHGVAVAAIAALGRLFEFGTIGPSEIQAALAQEFTDLEDAVIHETARSARAEAIVTRNVGDFSTATIEVFSPEALLATLDD